MDDFLIYSGYLILLIDLILYTYSFFRLEKANVFFVCYLAFAFTMQISMETLFLCKMNNLFLVNVFFTGQMILLGLFYHSILKVKVQKQFIKVSLILALCLLIIQFVNMPDEFLKFNLFGITLTSLLIVVFALLHFYNLLTENKTYYYTSMGVIIYLLSSTVLFIIGNLTSNLSNDVKYLSWMVNAFLNVVYYLFIMYEWKVSFSRKRVLQS